MKAEETPQLLMYVSPNLLYFEPRRLVLSTIPLLTKGIGDGKSSCGHGSIDDPDASIIYSETLSMLEDYPEISSDVLVVQLGPSDQCEQCLFLPASAAS
jgi:hypothetical protein